MDQRTKREAVEQYRNMRIFEVVLGVLWLIAAAAFVYHSIYRGAIWGLATAISLFFSMSGWYSWLRWVMMIGILLGGMATFIALTGGANQGPNVGNAALYGMATLLSLATCVHMFKYAED